MGFFFLGFGHDEDFIPQGLHTWLSMLETRRVGSYKKGLIFV